MVNLNTLSDLIWFRFHEINFQYWPFERLQNYNKIENY